MFRRMNSSLSLTQFRQVFQPRLKIFWQKKQQMYAALIPDTTLQSFLAYPSTLMESGGKRLRPYLLYLLYKMAGGRNDAAIIDLSISLELFHNFALIHDDIIDRGETRHGILTTHRMITQQLAKEKRTEDREHIGEGQAMLLGDILLVLAFEHLSTAKGISRERRDAAYPYLTTLAQEVIIGQMLDVDGMKKAFVSDDIVFQKTFLKTATYSFIHPMHIGVALAGDIPLLLDFSDRFGTALGLAFQLQDDLFDLTSSASVLQKTVFSDLREGQHTYFTQYISTHGTSAQKKTLKKFFGKPVTEKDRSVIHALFTETGALDAGITVMETFFDGAEKLLAELRVPAKKKERLHELLKNIRDRQQ